VFGGLLLLLGSTAFVLLDRGLRSNLDDSLASVARAIAASSAEASGSDLADTLEGMLGPALAERFFQLLDPFGRPDPRLPRRGRWTFPLSEAALRNAEAGRETFESIPNLGASRGDLRLLTLPVIERGRLVHFVQVAASLDRVDQALSRFLLVMLSLAPLALAGAAIGGWFLAGRALSPVEAMVAAARRISAEDLSMRLKPERPEDELGRLAAVLNDMLARLERSFTTARQFGADAAHELGSPLTILKGELEVALRTASLDRQGREVIQSCLEEVDRLVALVEDLLFLARADADVALFRGEPVDLAALAREVEPGLEVLAERAGVTLSIDASAPIVVKGNEPLLLRVLFNLAENGIKYAGAGKCVEITVRSVGEKALLEVRDNGPGIAQAERERIFDRFYRGDPARERSGTGLGLALVKSIVRLHGGEIRLESEPGRGSCFQVQLSLADRPK
jgi:heavy metal sensor kinase